MALREYKTTKDQAAWLQKIQWTTLPLSYGQGILSRISSEGLFVFSSHSEEWSQNRQKLPEFNKHHPIDAVSIGLHSRSSSSDKAGGLVRTLYLARGAKVMLTTNLNVQYRLFNGSMGTVVDNIYTDRKFPKDSFPTVCMIVFPRYTGPSFLHSHPKVVPNVPVEKRLDCNCFHCKRKQIPLRLGWGTTIHRCQGMSVGEGEANLFIIINSGTRQFESRTPGALFVALSRAKSSGGVNVFPDFAFHPDILGNEDRLCYVVNTSTTKARKVRGYILNMNNSIFIILMHLAT